MSSPVVIYVSGGEVHGTPAGAGLPRGVLPADFPHAAHAEALARGRHDPHRVHREFPERWRAYIRANFRDYADVTQTFGVCERTARKWWEGETGCVGGYVAVAVQVHPEIAPRMLFSEAA